MASVLTTIVLEFGSDLTSSDFSCQVELDELLNVVNGETVSNFEPGNPCYLLTKCSDNVRITRIESTWGQVSTLGPVNRDKTDELLFVAINSIDNNPSLSYAPNGAVVPEWIGNIGGTLIVAADNSVTISSGTVPCYCSCEYSTSFVSHRLSHNALALDEYNIHVVVYLEEI